MFPLFGVCTIFFVSLSLSIFSVRQFVRFAVVSSACVRACICAIRLNVCLSARVYVFLSRFYYAYDSNEEKMTVRFVSIVSGLLPLEQQHKLIFSRSFFPDTFIFSLVTFRLASTTGRLAVRAARSTETESFWMWHSARVYRVCLFYSVRRRTNQTYRHTYTSIDL